MNPLFNFMSWFNSDDDEEVEEQEDDDEDDEEDEEEYPTDKQCIFSINGECRLTNSDYGDINCEFEKCPIQKITKLLENKNG